MMIGISVRYVGRTGGHTVLGFRIRTVHVLRPPTVSASLPPLIAYSLGAAKRSSGACE